MFDNDVFFYKNNQQKTIKKLKVNFKFNNKNSTNEKIEL